VAVSFLRASFFAFYGSLEEEGLTYFDASYTGMSKKGINSTCQIILDPLSLSPRTVYGLVGAR
jgi:hypothetical protein